MEDIFRFLATWEYTKVMLLIVFFITFVGVGLYVLTGKKRGERLESYKNIPFLDDEDKVPHHEHRKDD